MVKERHLIQSLGSEWHRIVELSKDSGTLRLEQLRQKLVSAMELFPNIHFTSNMESIGEDTINFDKIMDEIEEYVA